MDKLAKQLRDDALRIDAEVSDELDARIRASLNSVVPETPANRRPQGRTAPFWWWSSLTGVAAALAIIAIINIQKPDPAPAIAQTAQAPLKLPEIDWKAREAVLTSPLEQEIEHLREDLKKAEEAVKEDIDRLF
jgi:hypothetical protein